MHDYKIILYKRKICGKHRYIFWKENLIYSKSNSKGKSTYLRLLFYALGYSIPQMKDIKYSDIVTELYFEEKGNYGS